MSHTRKRARNVAASAVDIWQLLRIVLGVMLLSLFVYALIALVRIDNRLHEDRRCLDISRFRVQPEPSPLPASATAEPYAFGYIYFETSQEFVRWRIADSYQPNGVAVADVRLMGPRNVEQPGATPVALALGAAHNAVSVHFQGNATMDAYAQARVLRDPSSYYVALFGVDDADNEIELGRDYLNKRC